ncbi:MAG: gamma-glutamyltransferase [Pirellulaceae bacterium]
MRFGCRVRVCGLLVGLTVVTTSLSSIGDEPFGRAVHQAKSRGGMVVSASKVASEIGRDILAKGGNAVDAAVAVGFAMAVSWPEAGNIGGGGFMMVAPPEGDVRCIEYREMAPGTAHRHSFTLGETALSHKAAGVPGTVAGLFLAHKKYGKLEWAVLVDPAIRLAKNGVFIDRPLASSINKVLALPVLANDARFNELRRVYGKPDGTLWKVGDTLLLPDLASTLQRIADLGPAGFYQGPVAKLIAEEMSRQEGLISEQDLLAYHANDRAAIKGKYRQFEIFGAPPPSSGGTCTVIAMEMLESFDLRAHADRFSFRTLHLMGEAMRHAFHQRALNLGDSDFIEISPQLLTPEFALALAEKVDLNSAGNSVELAAPLPIVEESNQTTHFSVVDADGMAVSNTYTLEASWGCKIVVVGAGFVLNNEMGDFNWIPGRTDTKGRIGTEPNTIQPRKRMLSSQTPTIVRKDGRVVLVTGSPGGRTIINTVISILVSHLEYELPLDQAVRGPRSHHQWLPDTLSFEGLLHSDYEQEVARLNKVGHQLTRRYPQGSAQSIAIDKNGVAWGVGDWRRSGFAAGVESDK